MRVEDYTIRELILATAPTDVRLCVEYEHRWPEARKVVQRYEAVTAAPIVSNLDWRSRRTEPRLAKLLQEAKDGSPQN